MPRAATSNGAVVVVAGRLVEVVVEELVVDVDAGVVLVACSLVAGVVVAGVVVVVIDVSVVAINSSNWLSARSWARANSMPVPHS